MNFKCDKDANASDPVVGLRSMYVYICKTQFSSIFYLVRRVVMMTASMTMTMAMTMAMMMMMMMMVVVMVMMVMVMMMTTATIVMPIIIKMRSAVNENTSA